MITIINTSYIITNNHNNNNNNKTKTLSGNIGDTEDPDSFDYQNHRKNTN